MSWSGLAKFLIGFFLAVTFLLTAGAATAYYFFTKLTTPPPKPIFPEELPKPKIAKPKNASPSAKSKSSPTAQSGAATNKTEKASTKLEPGAYKARVTWHEGLSLRSEPNPDAERIGGIQYNEQIVVLAESADKKWQQVRLENSDQKGWIRSGNLEKVDEQQADRSNNTKEDQ